MVIVPIADRTDAGQRLDAFVDAAFAFALTLLLITGGAPTNMNELVIALGRIPAFLASFALIAMFWLGHREYSQLAGRRGPWSTVLSLGIVFVVLVYVFPLRLLAESTFHFMSGGRLPGQGLITSYGDLTMLYLVYGAGFAVLAGLCAALFAGVRGAGAASPRAEAEAREWSLTYLLLLICGLLSMTAALFGPTARMPWLPGVIYGLIPAGLPLIFWFTRRAPAPPVEAKK